MNGVSIGFILDVFKKNKPMLTPLIVAQGKGKT